MGVLGVEMCPIGDIVGGDVVGSEQWVAWWQRRCSSHDDGGVVEMRMYDGSVVGGGVGWRGGGCDYDCEIRYHPGNANVVVDALSRKERVKPKRVKAINMTLQSSIKDRILAVQKGVSDESTGL
ncbi:hypothetical protein Tco_0482598 [Tanacetum coccineum]